LKVLVTGGSGFIGSHIVDKLKQKEYEVRVFDKQKPRRDDVEWMEGDLLNEKDVIDACKDVEVIFHLAAIADVNVALSHFETCFLVNELGTMNFLKGAQAEEVERFILASTTWVYGNSYERVDENTPIPLPDHIYTKTKIGQEQLVYAWHKHNGLPFTILRFDIPYGPRMRANMAISIFARRAMRHEPITIFGDGNQGRCFIYVEDLAEGNVAAIKDEAKNDTFNLAGSEFVTMNQIVENLQKIFGNLEVRHEPPRPHDFKGVMVSIEKAKERLKWEPKTPFEKGLKRFVESVKAETRSE
jgi:UDP-glucose 4-epimerase